MADEINTQSDNQVTFAAMVQALQNNTTAVTHAANIIATGTDAQKKILAGKAEDVMTTPGLTEKAVSKALASLVNDMHARIRRGGPRSQSGVSKMAISELNKNMAAFNVNLVKLISNKDIFQPKKNSTDTKIVKLLSNRLPISSDTMDDSSYSKTFRKFSARYPGYKVVFPQIHKFSQNLAAMADMLNKMGFKGIAKKLSRLSFRGTSSLSGVAKVGGLMATVGIAKFAYGLIKSQISDFYKGMSSSAGMEAMTGRAYHVRNQTAMLSRAALMGYDRETAISRQREFAQAGITNQEQFLSGLAAEKAYGVTNVAQYYQMLTRRTDAVSRYGNDLAKTFARLVPIAKNAGMGVSEMQQQVVSFTDSIKGGGFKDSAVQSMLSTYSGLIKTRELSAQEVASLYNRTQTLDFGKHMTATLFAQRGGYNFKSDNLLGQAYELRRLQGGDLASKGRLASAQLRGVLSNFGVSSFSQLPDSQKMMFLENILPQTLGIDVGRLPSADKIIGMLERGADITKMGGSLQSELENAQRKSTEDIVRGLDALQNPVNHIREYMLSYFTGGREGFKKYLEDQKIKEANGTKPQPIQLTAYIDQKMKDDLDIKFGVPGQPVKTAPIRR